jgi:hypothetical protein
MYVRTHTFLLSWRARKCFANSGEQRRLLRRDFGNYFFAVAGNRFTEDHQVAKRALSLSPRAIESSCDLVIALPMTFTIVP